MHEPWNDKPEWASGRLRSDAASSALLMGLFALAWNAFAWTVIAATWEEAWEALRNREPGPWLVWLFGAIALALAGFALRRLLIWWRFGSTVFAMSAVPGVVGGKLEGSIQTRIGAGQRPTAVVLTLECLNRETSDAIGSRGTGERRTSTRTVWSSSLDVDPNQLRVGPEGLSIPVEFWIPDSCTPTVESDPDDEYYWRLRLHADLPGVDLETAWTVPVFRTEASRELGEEEQRRRASARASSLAGFHPSREEPIGFAEPVVVVQGPTGATEYLVRLESSVRQLVGALSIASLAFGFLVVAYTRGWHVGFLWASGAVLLLYLMGLAAMFFYRGRIVLEATEIRISVRFLFLTFGRVRIPFTDVASVYVTGSESTQGSGKRQRWSVVIDRRGDDPVDTGALIASRKRADWLAHEIENHARRSRRIRG